MDHPYKHWDGCCTPARRSSRRRTRRGVFEVEVAVRGEVKYTARPAKCAIEATCPLKLQLAPPGQAAPAAVVFQKVKCKLAKAEKHC